MHKLLSSANYCELVELKVLEINSIDVHLNSCPTSLAWRIVTRDFGCQLKGAKERFVLARRTLSQALAEHLVANPSFAEWLAEDSFRMISMEIFSAMESHSKI